MSKSLRPPTRRVAGPRRNRPQVWPQAFTVPQISLSGCSNCADFHEVQARVEGVLTTVVCPVCRPVSFPAVAR